MERIIAVMVSIVILLVVLRSIALDILNHIDED